MGSLARHSRYERFVTEFGADCAKDMGLQVGDVLTVRAVVLALEGGHDMVRTYVTLQAPGGQEFVLASDVYFDPEESGYDLVASTALLLDLTEEEASRRLRKAQLF